MNFIERSYNGVNIFSLESKLGENRIILIDQEINSTVANEFLKQMMVLNLQSKTEPITVYINSPGGEVSQGLMMYDVIQGSPAPVRLVCTGAASSMAAILFASGNPAHGRYILPNAKVMIHEPLIRGGLGGSASSIKSFSDSLLETRTKMNSILAKHTGHTLEEINDATSYDHFFSAEEAVDFGLCDKVVDFEFLMNL